MELEPQFSGKGIGAQVVGKPPLYSLLTAGSWPVSPVSVAVPELAG